jgi:hypothetical protein
MLHISTIIERFKYHIFSSSSTAPTSISQGHHVDIIIGIMQKYSDYKWHDVHTKFNENRSVYSKHIRGTDTIPKAYFLYKVGL